MNKKTWGSALRGALVLASCLPSLVLGQAGVPPITNEPQNTVV